MTVTTLGPERYVTVPSVFGFPPNRPTHWTDPGSWGEGVPNLGVGRKNRESTDTQTPARKPLGSLVVTKPKVLSVTRCTQVSVPIPFGPSTKDGLLAIPLCSLISCVERSPRGLH